MDKTGSCLVWLMGRYHLSGLFSLHDFPLDSAIALQMRVREGKQLSMVEFVLQAVTSSMEAGRDCALKGDRKAQGSGEGITCPDLSLPLNPWLSLQAWSDNEEISCLLAQRGQRVGASKKIPTFNLFPHASKKSLALTSASS